MTLKFTGQTDLEAQRDALEHQSDMGCPYEWDRLAALYASLIEVDVDTDGLDS